jgi:hypothetical protein
MINIFLTHSYTFTQCEEKPLFVTISVKLANY